MPAEPSMLTNPCFFFRKGKGLPERAKQGATLASGSGGNYQNLEAVVDSSGLTPTFRTSPFYETSIRPTRTCQAELGLVDPSWNKRTSGGSPSFAVPLHLSRCSPPFSRGLFRKILHASLFVRALSYLWLVLVGNFRPYRCLTLFHGCQSVRTQP